MAIDGNTANYIPELYGIVILMDEQSIAVRLGQQDELERRTPHEDQHIGLLPLLVGDVLADAREAVALGDCQIVQIFHRCVIEQQRLDLRIAQIALAGNRVSIKALVGTAGQELDWDYCRRPASQPP